MGLQLDLSTLSDEQLLQIIKVLKEENKEKEPEQIKLDTGNSFDSHIENMTQNKVDGLSLREKRMKGSLNEHDKETYRQLDIIYKMGKENFWAEVKRIVEARQEIDMRGVDDKIDFRRYL